ncbi:hypothetical protein D3C80_1426650 [compost metagenome]
MSTAAARSRELACRRSSWVTSIRSSLSRSDPSDRIPGAVAPSSAKLFRRLYGRTSARMRASVKSGSSALRQARRSLQAAMKSAWARCETWTRRSLARSNGPGSAHWARTSVTNSAGSRSRPTLTPLLHDRAACSPSTVVIRRSSTNQPLARVWKWIDRVAAFKPSGLSPTKVPAKNAAATRSS